MKPYTVPETTFKSYLRPLAMGKTEEKTTDNVNQLPI